MYVFLVHVLFSLSPLSHSPRNGVRIISACAVFTVFVKSFTREWLRILTSRAVFTVFVKLVINNCKQSVLTFLFVVCGIVICV